MSTFKGTPGPWNCGPSKYNADRFTVQAGMPSMRVLACFDGDGEGYDKTDEANARLIAAAPELLVALDHLLLFAVHADSCGDQDAYNNAETPSCGCGLEAIAGAARAAIAKATGGAA